MNNLVCIFLFTLGLVCMPLGAGAGDMKNGEAIANAECVACHGQAGNSATPMFPKIAGLGEKYLLKQLVDIKNAGPSKDSNKPARMIVEMATLLDNKSQQDLEDMAAYYASQTMQLSGAKAIEVQINTGEKVDSLALGTKVYRSGNLETGVPSCSGCHSPRGLGNAPAGYPRLSGQYADYIEKQLKAFRAGDRTNDSDKVMREVAAKMSDAEIKAVANFIAGLN